MPAPVAIETEEFLRGLPIIDAHHHFWDLDGPVRYPWLQSPPWPEFRYGDYRAIRSSFLPDDYAQATGPHRVVGSVHMEAEPAEGMATDEIAWLDGLRDKAPLAAAAQVWLDRADAGVQIARLSEWPMVRSVRHKPVGSPRDTKRRGVRGSMDCDMWRRGYALLARHGLKFELQTPWWHLDAAAELARDFPDTTLILNHCGLPADRTTEGLTHWENAVAQLSDLPNVVVKLSGIGLAPGWWPDRQNRWIIRRLITMFGADRAMFASNFPVDSLCVGFDRMFAAYKSAASDLPHGDVERLFAGTAARVYGIEVPSG